MFESRRLQAVMAEEKYATVPYIGDRFRVDNKPLFPHYKRMVTAALLACQSYERQKPSWSPSLPLCSFGISELLRHGDPRLSLVGYFASSWACANWSKSHPPFFVYASGVMACPNTPECIRTDPRLLREFPPTLVTELDQALCWNTFERTLEFTQQLMRQTEHLLHCDMPTEAERLEEAVKQITGISKRSQLYDSAVSVAQLRAIAAAIKADPTSGLPEI
jgi:hypothetical protein